MRLLLAAAVLVALPAAAPAIDRSGVGSADASSVRIHRDGDFRRDGRDRGDFRRDDDDRRDRRRGDAGLILYSYGGGVSDRAFQPDSFNDWWHDRPDRAYPAWIARNRNCEREYWSGGGWRC